MSRELITNRNTAAEPGRDSINKYAASWQTSPNYIVTLEVRGDNSGGNFAISTSVDESFSISMSSQWDDPYANVLSEALSGVAGASVAGIAKQVGQATGLSARSRYSSARVWQSSSPIGFQIPFTFIAQEDPYEEVQLKVQKLLKLVAPSPGGDGMREKLGEKAGNAISLVSLKAPGPTIKDQLMGGINISLRIGNFLLLDNCVIENVDVQFDSIMGDSGIPHKAKATVDVKSYFTCFTTADIDNMFVRKG